MKRQILFVLLFISSFAYCQTNILSLKDAVNIALKNNPDVKISKQKIDVANAKYSSGISLPQPNLSLSYEYTPTGSGLSEYGERTFEINQSFEFPTRYFSRGAKLNKDVESARLEYEYSSLKLTGEVKTKYYKVLLKQAMFEIANDNLTICEDFEYKSQIRYNVGEGTNLELLTAKVQKAEAKNKVECERYELKAAISELQLLMGNPEKTDLNYVMSDSLQYTKYNYSLETLKDFALNNNLNLRIADSNIESLSLEKSLAWQSILPNFNLSYYRQAIPGNTNFYGVSFGVSVPLWFMFDQKGKIQEADINMSSAETEKISIRNKIITNVKNDYAEFRDKERELLLFQSDILAQADEIYRTARISYEQGEANYLLLLEAKKTLITAKSEYINSLYLYNTTFVNLEQTVGKLLENIK